MSSSKSCSKEDKTSGKYEEYIELFLISMMKSRCPQVLMFEKSADRYNTKIIRSTLKNTLIHQKRIHQDDYPDSIVSEFVR